MVSEKVYKNIKEVGEILVRLAASEDATERALLSSSGVRCLMDILAETPESNLDDIDVPDFMKIEN